jgi:DNA-binding SARP family transcriptional activator
VEFRILGPLEVLEDGRPLALGRLKERAVLSVLLLHANEFVSRDRLIDELWGTSPPPTARKAVNVHISRLRQTLMCNGHDPIATAEGGYRLAVDPAQFDAERVRILITQARGCIADGDSATASRLLREALALWRGSTLTGIHLESFGRDEVAQLDELRLAALMDRIDCDLALARHEQVLGELSLLVREHPLRERLRAQQMLALYRADRQAEALDAYSDARRTLVDDLGIEPSEALQRLQQAILRHDPALATPEGTAAVNGSLAGPAAPIPTPAAAGDQHPVSHRARPHRWQFALAGLAIFTASAVVAVRLSGSATATPRVVPNSLVRLNPRNGKPTMVVPVGVEPGPIAITPAAIWTSNYGDNTVSRFDLRTHTVEARAGFPAQPFDVAVDGDGNAWITSAYEDHAPARNAFLTRLQAGIGGTSSGTLYPSHAQTVDLPLPMAGYEALGAGYLWVIVGGHGPLPGDDRVALIDLGTGQIASVRHLHHSATSIAFGYGSAWIGTYTRGANSWLEAIRAGAVKPTKVALQTHANWGPTWIAVGEGAVWVLMGSELFEVDPQTLQVLHRLDLSAEQPGVVAAGADAVWVTGGIGGGNSVKANSITKIDPRTAQIISITPLADRTRVTCGMAVTPSAVWVTLGNSSCDTIGQ